MKYYSLIFFLLTLFACSSTKKHTNFKYAKNPQMLQRPTLLRTDGVYVYVFNYEGKKDSYRFLRFFENGRCFASNFFKGNINRDTLETLNPKDGTKTFYRNNKNKVVYENWGGGYVYYVYNFCTVDSLGLDFNGYKPRSLIASREIYPDADRYNFFPIDFKNKTADW
ncbi:MAG: hypothetical protein J0I41_17215 [Filimonas sp.]|nr:hypothetical protein [Filimonas sp.]